MAHARTRSVVLVGVTGQLVEVEADIGEGLPSMSIVGLPDTAVAESKQRVRSAIRNSGFSWPDRRVTVSLSPASVHKRGSGLDLAIAVAILVAAKQIPNQPANRSVLIGELSLDGRVRKVKGALAGALAAVEAKSRFFFCPDENFAEASLVPDLVVTPVTTLSEVASVLRGETTSTKHPPETRIGSSFESFDVDLSDVHGHQMAKLALELCAAGGHHLMMVGPPGVGKTLLANRLPTLLPKLSRKQSLEVTAAHSAAGALSPSRQIIDLPQLVAPHHTASALSLIGGGGSYVRVGLVSLAHHGVLFLDEAPEYRRDALDALRQPLETGEVTVTRVGYHVKLPAKFQLCCAANQCPCGPPVGKACECSSQQRRRYLSRISGPILDRMDVRLNLLPPSRAELSAKSTNETSNEVRLRVEAARKRAALRLAETNWRTNSEVSGRYLRRHMWPGAAAAGIENAYHSRKMSMRGVERVIKVAWSAADCAGREKPTTEDVGLALALREADQLWLG